MSGSRWLLCPAAQEEAKASGIVFRCEGRRGHVCNGERTPYLWEAWDEDSSGARIIWNSEVPHCGSCLADEEEGFRSFGSSCCCSHATERSSWAPARAPR